MKTLPALALVILVSAAQYGRCASPDNASTKPILVELFTSEGCSSCPPADTLVQKLDDAQPVPGAQLIVLSEHVDYFNSDGWKDIYSSSLFTDRQKAYNNAMGVATSYTPQIIIDGSDTLPLNNPPKMIQVFQKAEANAVIPIQISAVTFEGASPAVLHAHIDIDGTSSKQGGDVYAAAALNHAESQVGAGENNGKHLTHVAVVQELVKVGKLQKGKAFTKDIEIKLKPGTDAGNIRLIVFIEKSGNGNVLGSALWKKN